MLIPCCGQLSGHTGRAFHTLTFDVLVSDRNFENSNSITFIEIAFFISIDFELSNIEPFV